MGENQFFLSYSRHQLYFAEALSLSLQKAGHDVWMDLHQLEPGKDWQDQIDVALRNCACLLLVASKQSLSSSYVESEWRAVLGAGKPIYIAYYEEVNLPAALQSASLVDFRGSFNKATHVLSAAIENMVSIRETVQSPNRLGLPQKMPPVIMLVAGLLVIETSFPLLTNFTVLGGTIAQIACLTITIPGICLLVWQFLHHKGVIVAGRLAFWSLIFLLFPISDWLGRQSDIGSLMNFLPELLVLIAIYLLERGSFGAELLRWSIPGSDSEIATLRRRFHKIPTTVEKQIRDIRQQALTARNLENNVRTAVELSQDPPADRPIVGLEKMGAYTLHYAAADRPVATTLRRVLDTAGLQEVDANTPNQILILSEKLPRSKLQELLDSGETVIPLLISNIGLQGDALLEQAASLQLIDYRDRSKSILIALAQTLKDVPDGNLPVGFETIPRPLNSTVLPAFVAVMSVLVFLIGGWLVLSGLVSMTQSLAGTGPWSILDFIGFVCGLIWIKLSQAVLVRETTNFHFVPALLISIWLAVPLFVGSFFEVARGLSTNTPFDWRLTLSFLFKDDSYAGCLICSVGLIVLPVAILWFRQFGDWLPATISNPEQADRFKLLETISARRRSWLAWTLLALFIGGLSTFGLRVVIYTLYSMVESYR